MPWKFSIFMALGRFEMKTKPWAIALMLLTTLLTATAQVFYKLGIPKLEFNFYSIITNYYLLIGLGLYAIGAALMITALKGGELSVLYPIIATSYIWVGLFSFFIFHESLNLLRWLGISSIFFGVIFIGLGSKNKEVIIETGEVL
jgi:drug/metabolite transporter (DMT)-like permease